MLRSQQYQAQRCDYHMNVGPTSCLVGSIVSGPIIVLRSLPLLGQRAIILACAIFTLIGLGLVHAARQVARNSASAPKTAEDAPIL